MSFIHYLEPWSEEYTDILLWDDDHSGEMEEWLEYLIECYYDDTQYLTNRPDEQITAEFTKLHSFYSEFQSVDLLAELLLAHSYPETADIYDYADVSDMLKKQLGEMFQNFTFSKEIGWITPIDGVGVYITHGELVELIRTEKVINGDA